jgi:hypothetical protein
MAAKVAPAEAHEIRESGMGAGGNAVLFGKRNRFPHDRGIAGMKSTGDVGRGDQRDDRLIQAQFVISKALADIGIQINGVHALAPAKKRGIRDLENLACKTKYTKDIAHDSQEKSGRFERMHPAEKPS